MARWVPHPRGRTAPVDRSVDPSTYTISPPPRHSPLPPFPARRTCPHRQVSEHHATCLSTGAYVLVANKAVAAGNVFLWCWETLQWNLCCRSVNVEVIRLEHMGYSGDSFRFKFKKAKNDQGGDVDHTKHVYANPLQPAVCAVLAWAVCANFDFGLFWTVSHAFPALHRPTHVDVTC